jgi:hypothetical protein
VSEFRSPRVRAVDDDVEAHPESQRRILGGSGVGVKALRRASGDLDSKSEERGAELQDGGGTSCKRAETRKARVDAHVDVYDAGARRTSTTSRRSKVKSGLSFLLESRLRSLGRSGCVYRGFGSSRLGGGGCAYTVARLQLELHHSRGPVEVLGHALAGVARASVDV